ncbi:MAG: DNA primase [Hyphomicrobiales bacterium]|nr:DNA primase [Hyphomicrobiales bacterium]
MSTNSNISEEIKSKVVLSDVIQKYVSWDSRKTNSTKGVYWACCPFHNEKTASFTVDNLKKTYHCFGCNASGDVYQFLMDIENINFPEALSKMANHCGVKLPEKGHFDPVENQKREILYKINFEASNFFIKELNKEENKYKYDYLKQRGLTVENINFFKIGYTKGGGHLISYLQSCGYNKRQISEAGLIIENDKGDYFERFRDRIIFPITDTTDRVIAFGGRDLSGKAQAKYLNSPETKLFQKKSVIYNFYNARKSLISDRPLIVTEGYFDTVALAINGYESSVATMGTSLSVEQINRLWQISNQPLLCYDGDLAGKNAAIRVIELIFPILKPGFSMNFLFLPDSMDPDDLLKNNGPKALDVLISNSVSLIDLFWNNFMNILDYGTPEDRAKIESHMLSVISKITNAEVKRHYKYEIINKLNAYWKSKSFESNKIFFTSNKVKLPSKELITKSNKNIIGNSISKGEALYISTIIKYPELVGEYLEEIVSIKLKNDRSMLLNKKIIDYIISNKINNQQASLVLNHIKEIGFSSLLKEIYEFDLEKIYDFLNTRQDLLKVSLKFKNVLSEINKYHLVSELEDAKLNYSNSPTEENGRKLEELKQMIQKIRSNANITPSHNQENKKGFDKWYEENKSRLQKKDHI